MAAANVSGVIALLLARDRGATSAGVMHLLTSTSTRPDGAGSQFSVNATAALCALMKEHACAEPPSVAVAVQ